MTPPTVNERVEPRTLGALMAQARSRLVAAGIEAADREARWLLEHAVGLSSSSHLVDRSRLLEGHEIAKVDDCVSRRVAREPLQYILGTQEFCGLTFEVNPSVLIPRPETELLVQEVIRRLPNGDRPTVVDVGTGSGCLAVTLARAVQARIFATDFSADALRTAKANARRHGVDSSITWLEGDLLAPLDGMGCERSVHVIMANPPYIRESEWSGLQPEVARYEPRMALIAGAKGIEVHQRLLVEAAPYLAPGGLLVMEMGQGQCAALIEVSKTMCFYERAEILADEAGIDRIMIIERTR
jgi:release factor glutamine methyltransferase